MIDCDLCIVGAGIAGASLAARIAPWCRTILIDQEAQPGHHATGRSVAIFTHALSGAQVGPLTRASAAFFTAQDSVELPLRPGRPVLLFGDGTAEGELTALHDQLRAGGGRARLLRGGAVQELVPILRSEHAALALLDEDAFEIDVDAMLQGWLRQARAAGARLLTNARLSHAERIPGGWRLRAGETDIRARVLVNAAGAWGDVVARIAGLSPLGLTPLRRTVSVLPAMGLDPEPWPMCVAAGHDLYFKPDAGRLLVSGMEESPSDPCDAMVDDLEVAMALDRLETVTGLPPRRPLHSWAGLRTFAPDREPVAGFDPDDDAFFWLVGQGGTGMQTAPALGEAAVCLLRGVALPEPLLVAGVSPRALGPTRFRAIDTR
ncbi:NAD(P)/FAD-dependent oxidoreductase [Niveispirillum sp. KHB5.9]|uniref:NAD(P)/FAD-dependent oxidoreductase n=1 Tax=Niveispirillum sp. KHB5.9 TaxID=3400269 RepID=UPI003A8807B9